MSEATFLGIVTGWIGVGIVVASVMARRGHERFSWFVFSVLLGPLAVPFAIYEDRHNRTAAKSQDDHGRSGYRSSLSRSGAGGDSSGGCQSLGPGGNSAITRTTSSPMPRAQ